MSRSNCLYISVHKQWYVPYRHICTATAAAAGWQMRSGGQILVGSGVSTKNWRCARGVARRPYFPFHPKKTIFKIHRSTWYVHTWHSSKNTDTKVCWLQIGYYKIKKKASTAEILSAFSTAVPCVYLTPPDS